MAHLMSCIFLLIYFSNIVLGQNINVNEHANPPLRNILRSDGTIRVGEKIQGVFDPTGWQMTTGDRGAPRFIQANSSSDPADTSWDGRFGLPGFNRTVTAFAVSNNDVYVGGEFTYVGGMVANHVVKWSGNTCSALGSGVNGYVYALAVIGSDLYVGGYFTSAGGVPASGIARWDGNNWSALGLGVQGIVYALATQGTDLYVGGAFSTAGGVSANNIARWDGTAWNTLDSGLTPGWVNAIAINGNDVYVGGYFFHAGDVNVSNIAKWDGSEWSALGSGISYYVYALAISDTVLYAGGNFATAGGVTANGVASWNGLNWSGFGSGTNGTVCALTLVGTDLYIGGGFTTAGGDTVHYIAKWEGDHWSALGSGTDAFITALATDGTDLYVGGDFYNAGNVKTMRMAKWHSGIWMTLGLGADDEVWAVAVIGKDLYVGGNFVALGGEKIRAIAKWDGSHWSSLGSGITGYVGALAVGGNDLYVGGHIWRAGDEQVSNIVKWDGSKWSSLGPGLDGVVNALVVIGTDLYAGGKFSFSGEDSVSYIAKWDGRKWIPLGTGMSWYVLALAVNGSDLYAGGQFLKAGGVLVNRIAKWDGSKWSALGSGMNAQVYALAVSGSKLYAAGVFTTAGGDSANGVAEWNGSSWSPLSSGISSPQFFSPDGRALAVIGSNLYVGGAFTTAGGVKANYIAKWDGISWSSLGSGLDGIVWTLGVNGSDLYVGGQFSAAGAKCASYFARWGAPSPAFYSTPSTLNFGFVRPGETKIDSITITNYGTSDLIIDSVVSASGEFSAQPSSDTLPPTISHKFHVTFAPISPGPKLSDIMFYYNAFASPSKITVSNAPLLDLSWPLADNWNLLSVPVFVTDSRKSVLFEHAISDAFAYKDGYTIQETLSIGCGYWLRFKGTGNGHISGIATLPESIGVKQGWNLIGSAAIAIPTSTITSSLPDMTTSNFFGYADGYKVADTLYPGYGYWVKCDEDGTLILPTSGSMSIKSAAHKIHIVPTNELPPPPPDQQSLSSMRLPKQFFLAQSYPNPFNPTTTIEYALPEDSKVRLRIFNVLGQLVSIVVEGIEKAGYKEVIWNASGNASGIYFYRLEAISVRDPSDSFIQVKKTLLIK